MAINLASSAPHNHVFVIAEAGVNHNGSLDKALALVDAAVAAEADAVKFQTFVPDLVVTPDAEKAAYQKERTGVVQSQLQMIKNLHLDFDAFRNISTHCQQKGIMFLSTPFDLPSLSFLMDEIAVPMLKIPSGELTNDPFIWAGARQGRPTILSTGMATLDEISHALDVLAHGFLYTDPPTDARSLIGLHKRDDAQSVLVDKITILHCSTEYPAPPDTINLKAMATIGARFGLRVGYSDHSLGNEVPLAAAALGATVIEKHFTLDKNLPGPDHRASLSPEELARMVRSIRVVSSALGSGEKMPSDSELQTAKVARRSLVAATAIQKGDMLENRNIAIKRPGIGVSPIQYWDILGRLAKRDYAPNELLDASELVD